MRPLCNSIQKGLAQILSKSASGPQTPYSLECFPQLSGRTTCRSRILKSFFLRSTAYLSDPCPVQNVTVSHTPHTAKYLNSINTPSFYGYSLSSVLRTSTFGPPAIRLRAPTLRLRQVLRLHAFNVFGPLAHRLLCVSRSQDTTSSTPSRPPFIGRHDRARRLSTPVSGADEEISYLLGHANSRVHGLRGLLNVVPEAFGLSRRRSRR
ncbi:hypothetical protein C8R44DRAFT_154996 [Mycena epipterygia]|nr:hypothetical protein C8R44DRAFT_154996 [Mycena epipterygia]